MVQGRAITADQYSRPKLYYDLSNGTVFSDRVRPLPPISRSHHYSMLSCWISQKRYETDIVLMEYW